MVHLILTITTIFALFFTSPAVAKPKYLFKVASLAPQGSVWINHFREFSKEVKERSKGEIEIKIYPGGVMGDDLAMYRKMRIGQLQGGGFTMSGISKVVPDFRVMAIPFLFDNYTEIDAVSEKLEPYFKKKFDENGLEFMSLTEVGFIYGMSTSPTSTVDDLQKRKSWIPTGDPLAATYLKALGINPVPLTIPDVLSSLQTGLVDTVYTSLYGSLVMQWFTKATYITDIPYGYAYGAIAFSKKSFSKLPKNYAEMMHEVADKHFSALNKKTRQSNKDSREVLIKNGVTFVEATTEAKNKLVTTREVTIAKLNGESFSKEAFSLMKEIMNKMRTSK